MQEASPRPTAYQDAPLVGRGLESGEESPVGGMNVVAPTTMSHSPSPPPDALDPQAQAQLEADKRAVYKHPLFPLLALLFEKCERATQTAEAPSSESFSSDIQAFVQHQERDRRPFFSDDPDVDSLMVKAIQVLRIHLLELEKVQELCKDFCNRYIACLKSKMQSENLLRSADFPSHGGSEGGHLSDSDSSCSSPGPLRLSPSPPVQATHQNNCITNAMNPAQIVSGGTVYQMVQTSAGIMAQPIQIQPSQSMPVITAIHGGTPLSQIGANCSSADQEQRLASMGHRHLSLSMSGDDEEDDLLGSKKKQKRGVLPKHATSIMRSWLFQHIVHPYPTEDEKRQIAAQTNLTLLQVNNWFINARRRILQPMLDAGNPEAAQKAKKAKVQSARPVERFWPDALASLQPRTPSSSTSHGTQDASSNGHGAGGHGSDVTSDDSPCGGTLNSADEDNDNEENNKQ
ncbi:homeobox protein PKNOX2-like [Ornithodoros turicata]|uniref:Putative transcription factor meis1 n=1 Tax=Ornithodoros turicata TaxID=34597 RepID=A0A2R5LE29_9ACAR